MDLCLCYDSANGIAAALTLTIWVLLLKIIGSQGDVEMEHLSSMYWLPNSYIVTEAAVIVRCCQV